MSTTASRVGHATHPVDVVVPQAVLHRNRMTTAFRFLLALPHLVLVGGPIALGFTWRTTAEEGDHWEFGSAGVLGAVAFVCATIGWFFILFTGRYPEGLRALVAFYLRWRVRAVAYVALLRDEYPPFGEGAYPAELQLREPDAPRDRLTVAFRLLLVIPHLLAIWVLGVAWALTTIVAWFAILFTGRMPPTLWRFGVSMLRWNTRVEAYLLLLHDEYPPFSLD